jgi:hypothetical protein
MVFRTNPLLTCRSVKGTLLLSVEQSFLLVRTALFRSVRPFPLLLLLGHTRLPLRGETRVVVYCGPLLIFETKRPQSNNSGLRHVKGGARYIRKKIILSTLLSRLPLHLLYTLFFFQKFKRDLTLSRTSPIDVYIVFS